MEVLRGGTLLFVTGAILSPEEGYFSVAHLVVSDSGLYAHLGLAWMWFAKCGLMRTGERIKELWDMCERGKEWGVFS